MHKKQKSGLKNLWEYNDMNKLTPKQEKFCQLYVELGNKSDAYRGAYNVKSTTTNASVNSKAYELCEKVELRFRIDEIRKELAESNKVTRDDIVQGHKKIIKAWEDLWELGEKDELTPNEQKRFYLLKEMVKGSDYNKAYSEISKLTGAYEPDKVEIKDTTFKTSWGSE